ncbi:MAG: hypothetical protein QF681_05870 [Vicinamibacterales bacterium]|nr:hypothetical protein [Vicinamibacterales bacterium]
MRAVLLFIMLAGACGRAIGDGPAGDEHKMPESVVDVGEAIVGRAVVRQATVLLTDQSELISLEPQAGRSRRWPLRGANGATFWGLAWTEGALWTLVDRYALGRLASNGELAERIDLREPHVGLFGWKAQLILQPARWETGRPALRRGPTRGASGPFGALVLRPYPGPRAEMLAFNLVRCGWSDGTEVPCWFSDETTLDRIDAAGASRTLVVPGLHRSPEGSGVALEQRPRPIRDAYVTAADTLWVLTTAQEPTSNGDRYGRRLVQIRRDGESVGERWLPYPARLILRADRRAVHLLDAGGLMRMVPVG